MQSEAHRGLFIYKRLPQCRGFSKQLTPGLADQAQTQLILLRHMLKHLQGQVVCAGRMR